MAVCTYVIPTGMELYATALWHLQKDVQLSVVAETVHSSNKTSPPALCAMASVHESIQGLHLGSQVSPEGHPGVCVCVCVCVCMCAT